LQKKFKNKVVQVKTAIMDQKIVVGVGNIYACEALYRAGISPLRAVQEIRRAELESLVSAVREVLKEAIASGGASLRDYRTAYDAFGYFQQKLAVYGRKGLACPSCSCHIKGGGGILRLTQAGRSTFYCPQKQL
jgi:formamidopyrimidine-DNA glycosylase